jgi:Na+-driven multidrug efflux pump
MNTTQAGIIRGLGLQSRAARYQTIAMFGVMLPVGYFAYPYLGVPGVWTGSIAGMVTSAILFFTIIQNADYQECSRRAIQESRLHVIESLVTDI